MEIVKYIRLSLDTLFRAPNCYTYWSLSSTKCNTCPVSHQCMLQIKPENKEVS